MAKREFIEKGRRRAAPEVFVLVALGGCDDPENLVVCTEFNRCSDALAASARWLRGSKTRGSSVWLDRRVCLEDSDVLLPERFCGPMAPGSYRVEWAPDEAPPQTPPVFHLVSGSGVSGFYTLCSVGSEASAGRSL